MEMIRHHRTIRNLFPTRIRRFQTMVKPMSKSPDRSYLSFADLDENKDDPTLAFGGSSVSFKQGRQLLRQ